MLILPIKKKWFDMILTGEKKEEYREIKPYWKKRFQSSGLLDGCGLPTGFQTNVLFQNGYSRQSPKAVASVKLHIAKGREDWGAEKDVDYYVLRITHIDEILT